MFDVNDNEHRALRIVVDRLVQEWRDSVVDITADDDEHEQQPAHV